jgi:hypothetical protein
MAVTPYDSLSDADKKEYGALRTIISRPCVKNRRNKSIETFSQIIECIRRFVVRTDADDRKRALACGICWIGDTVAVNIQQLSHLTSRCKSSMNGTFQMMGYGTIPAGCDAACALLDYLPGLRGNFTELRKWSVRQKIAHTPGPPETASLLLPETPAFITPPPLLPGDLDAFAGLPVIVGASKERGDGNGDQNETIDVWDTDMYSFFE